MLARALAERILKEDLPNPFALRDVYRPQWTDLTSREDAKRAIDVLVDRDWFRDVEDRTTGGRPSTRYFINPRVHDIAG
jgi:hypothetical protein